MERIEIIDNFLPEDIFYPLKNLMTSSKFPWFFNNSVVEEDSSPETRFH